MSNINFNNAKRNKNDEFQTLLGDIESEILNYNPEVFYDKVIYCNCDDFDYSNFANYFMTYLNEFRIKKVICTSYNPNNEESIKYEIIPNEDDDNFYIKEYKIKGDGDFRSKACLEILRECDMVITNPPFSLFREFINTLTKYKKDFLIIGRKPNMIYKDLFDLYRENKIRYGYTSPKCFFSPEKGYTNFGNVGWFTNLEVNNNDVYINLTKSIKVNRFDYKFYDNYKILNVDRVRDIPYDCELTSP